MSNRKKVRLVAIISFFTIPGLHRFYIGDNAGGILIFLSGFSLLIGRVFILVDIFRFNSLSDQEFDAKYTVGFKFPNLFGIDQSISIEKNKVITITKRTVRFSYNVHQTHNIASFAEGEVEMGGIPWGIIVACLILGLIMYAGGGIISTSAGNSQQAEPFFLWAVYLYLASIVGMAWNILKPKYYGLLLTLNSGDKTLFTTKNKESLKQVIGVIYEFIEAEKEATYQISISNSEVSGNFIQGDVGGDTSYRSGN
jgi:TM2 domain-containing membrane protein YozV